MTSNRRSLILLLYAIDRISKCFPIETLSLKMKQQQHDIEFWRDWKKKSKSQMGIRIRIRIRIPSGTRIFFQITEGRGFISHLGLGFFFPSSP